MQVYITGTLQVASLFCCGSKIVNMQFLIIVILIKNTHCVLLLCVVKYTRCVILYRLLEKINGGGRCLEYVKVEEIIFKGKQNIKWDEVE